MSQRDIERLRALEKAVELVAKATPGPWAQEHRRGSDSSYRTEVFDEHGEAIATLTWHPKPPIYEGGMKGTSTDRAENAEAIVAAVNFIREHGSALIAELGQEVGAVAWTKDAEEYGNALNEAAWKFVEECPEKSALLFNNTKKPLRAAILTYAEHVARATSPAHTSEARDAARYRWMRRGLANTKLLPDGVADLFADAMDKNDATKFDAAIDAAMRQEAE